MVSRTIRQSQTAVTSYEVVRIQLMAWGALMATIYAVYLLVFPLLPTIYQSDRILEIERMLREGRKWFAPIYLVGLLVLFYAFWRILKIVHTFSQEDPEAAKSLRIWVLGLGALSGLLLIGLYPITALDVALYVVRARLWALYGGSPMLALPASFPQDPYVHLAGEFNREVSPYGPLWELIAQIPVRLGILDIASGIIAMKLISFLSYIAMAVLIGWYAHHTAPQRVPRYSVSSLTAITFFALNPLVLVEAIGNGHNDMVMLALMTFGLVLCQRDQWAWAALALTLASLIKVTGLIIMPLFAVSVLVAAPNWRTRILRGLSIAAIFIITAGIAYRLTGPFPDVFVGAQHVMFDRWGYTPIYLLRVITSALYPTGNVATLVADLSRSIFVVYFIYLLISLAQRKMTLIQAGFLAYFSQLLLGTTFRIWYPLWLIPFASLGLNSRTFWRTFLFGLTAELSLVLYLTLWRWKLDSWDWGLHGPLKAYWKYWIIMTAILAPWVFGIPILGPLLRKRKSPERFDNSLWI